MVGLLWDGIWLTVLSSMVTILLQEIGVSRGSRAEWKQTFALWRSKRFCNTVPGNLIKGTESLFWKDILENWVSRKHKKLFDTNIILLDIMVIVKEEHIRSSWWLFTLRVRDLWQTMYILHVIVLYLFSKTNLNNHVPSSHKI